MDNASKFISQEQVEEFERFLLGHMSASKEVEFHQKLDKNEVLKERFNEFKELFVTAEEDGLRNVLESFHEGFNEKVKLNRTNFNRYRIAASVAVLVAVGIWFFNRQSHNEKLYYEYFSPDPGLPTVMGEIDNYPFYEAMVDYKRGEYDIAIEKWEKLKSIKPDNDTLNYFLGNAHLANGNTAEAIDFFKNTLKSQTSPFHKEARYYMALGLLKKNNVPEAIKHLEMVSDNRSKGLITKIQE